MVVTSDETQIQIFAYWPMLPTKRVTKDKRKNPEYHVVVAIRRLRTGQNCPAEKSWPNHVKNEQHIGSTKNHGPRNTKQFKQNEDCANENALGGRSVDQSITPLLATPC